MKPRIFDHLDGEPEDAVFSRVAHAMRRSPGWRAVPTYAEPAPVAGEIDRNKGGR